MRSNTLFALGILGVAAALSAAIVLANPWKPDFDFVSLSGASLRYDPIDQILIDNSAFISRHPALLASLVAQPRTLKMSYPLAVDRCEVTQKAFQKFVVWRSTRPEELEIAAANEPRGFEYFSATESHYVFGRRNRPANGVSFFGAYAYCKAAGGRLPRSEEWEAIARGQEGRLFPWGDAWNEGPWKKSRTSNLVELECGNFPFSDTPEGVSDMATGVSEWTMGQYPEGLPGQSGGNTFKQASDLYSLPFVYILQEPSTRSPYLGFRCVYPRDGDPAGKKTLPWGTEVNRALAEVGEYLLGPNHETQIPKVLRLLGPSHLTQLKKLVLNSAPDRISDIGFASHEVTRAQYSRFLADPAVRLNIYAHPQQPKDHSYVPLNWRQQTRQPEAPVSGVSLWDALAFSSWASVSLPTADEWLLAAKGRERRLYPWGDTFDAEVSATLEARLHGAAPAGSFRRDRTPDGVFDLGGNVSEWTATQKIDRDRLRVVVKGGNFLVEGRVAALSAAETWVAPSFRSMALGFRVVDRRRSSSDTP